MPQKNKLSLSVQYADPTLKEALPRDLLRRWVKAALLGPAELTLRFVNAEEGRQLNRDYRNKDYATNVLTFSYSDEADADDLPVQADIVLCTDVLQEEARAQGKQLNAHAAHLVVHGVLHAQGYDHEDDEEAVKMEALETRIMATLEFADPYTDR